MLELVNQHFKELLVRVSIIDTLSLFFVIYVSRLPLLYRFVCSLQPCDHLLGKGCPLGSLVCDAPLCFTTFPYGVSGQEWYLIVSIPDLCFLLYFS